MSNALAEPESDEPHTRRASEERDGADISLLDLLILLAKHKRIVIGVPVVAAVMAVIYSLSLPNVYTGRAKILLPQQNQSSTMAFLGQLSALSGIAGNALPIKTPGDFYVGMLNSRTVADGLINRFELLRIYGAKTMTAARQALVGSTVIVSGKDSIITIEVDDKDPKRAADLANGYVEELYKLTQTLAVTESSQRRLFFEKQLKAAKEGLVEAEVALKRTQQQTGLVRLDEQGRAIIENVARMRAQVVAKEVQLSAMRAYATGENPNYLVAQRELDELRAQLARSEKDNRIDQGSVFLPTGRIAESGLEYIRRLRDVKYHEAIYELLGKQFEAAKLDEAREGTSVQVLDTAVVPDRKSKPKRAQIVIICVFIAALGALLWVALREILARANADPGGAEQLQIFRRYLLSR